MKFKRKGKRNEEKSLSVSDYYSTWPILAQLFHLRSTPQFLSVPSSAQRFPAQSDQKDGTEVNHQSADQLFRPPRESEISDALKEIPISSPFFFWAVRRFASALFAADDI